MVDTSGVERTTLLTLPGLSRPFDRKIRDLQWDQERGTAPVSAAPVGWASGRRRRGGIRELGTSLPSKEIHPIGAPH